MLPDTLQQTTLETLTHGEIAQNKQFLHLPQRYSIIVPLVIEIVHIFAKMFTTSTCADLLYVGKG